MGPSPFSDGRSVPVVLADLIPGLLQWGHRLSAMEGAPTAHLSEPVGRASMGPSPFSDGRMKWWRRWRRLIGLQWGHRLSAMEGRQPPGALSCPLPASMGPSPFSDGRPPRCHPGQRAGLGCFNGAIAFQRWKAVLPGWEKLALLSSFNGAIAFQRWKGDDILSTLTPIWRFNGAIAFQRWKGLFTTKFGLFVPELCVF